MSCGQAHSSAREFVAQGNETKLVAGTRHISRSSLYYQAKPRRQSRGSLARPGDHHCLRRKAGLRISSRGLVVGAASRTGGQCYIARFHRSLKEEDEWLNEYQNFDHAKLSITRWIEEYSHDRPHRGVRGKTPHESRAQFLAQTLTSNMAPCV